MGTYRGVALLSITAATLCWQCGSQPVVHERAGGTALFSEEAKARGIDFQHFNGMTGDFYIAEIMGAGGAFFDYDNDGDLDVYLVQGEMLGANKSRQDAIFPPAANALLSDRLYRNEQVESGALRFTDVTEAAGLVEQAYGMGVTTGDYDNDGYVDLYVTNFGPNRLLRNRGDGTFEDRTIPAAVAEPRWSVSAAFVDIDNDGWLDLYVGNYLDFDPAVHKACFKQGKEYCHPLTYAPVPDRLWRNRGDGTFEDISAVTGLAEAYGNSLGVITADLDDNGWLDLYVANDGQANFLWMNRGNGRFEEQALMTGAALNAAGQAEASMGIDAADYDGDGDQDLFMTHLAGETNTIYVNKGGFFEDRTIQTQLSVHGKAMTGFGTAWFDYDNDGWLDLFVANGAVTTISRLRDTGDPFPLHQQNMLLRHDGESTYTDVTDQSGPAMSHSEVSRGAVFGDIDNDGDVDVLVTNNSGPARLLLNQVGSRNAWIGFRVVHTDWQRDLYGAEVTVTTSTGRQLVRQVRAAASYASANDPRVIIGLGQADAAVAVKVQFADGIEKSWVDLSTRRWHTLEVANPEK